MVREPKSLRKVPVRSACALQEDLGMEMAFPHAGDFEVLNRPHQGEEFTGVVAIGLRRMVFQIDLPFLPHEGLQELLCEGLDPLFQFF